MNGIGRIAAAFTMFCGIALGAAEIEVVKAVYGAGDATIDVTEGVKSKAIHVPGTLFLVPVSNAFFGQDPAKGQSKKLELTYRQDGVEKKVSAGELGSVIILEGAVPAKEFKILKAFYGAEQKWNDVTDKVAGVIGEGKSVMVGNEQFGDPIRGKSKQLVVVYTVNNELRSVVTGERKELKPDSFRK